MHQLLELNVELVRQGSTDPDMQAAFMPFPPNITRLHFVCKTEGDTVGDVLGQGLLLLSKLGHFHIGTPAFYDSSSLCSALNELESVNELRMWTAHSSSLKMQNIILYWAQVLAECQR